MDQINNNSETTIKSIEMTLGDLIEAITNMAMESGRSEDEAYYLTSCVLNDIIVRDSSAA